MNEERKVELMRNWERRNKVNNQVITGWVSSPRLLPRAATHALVALATLSPGNFKVVLLPGDPGAGPN